MKFTKDPFFTFTLIVVIFNSKNKQSPARKISMIFEALYLLKNQE